MANICSSEYLQMMGKSLVYDGTSKLVAWKIYIYNLLLSNQISLIFILRWNPIKAISTNHLFSITVWNIIRFMYKKRLNTNQAWKTVCCHLKNKMYGVCQLLWIQSLYYNVKSSVWIENNEDQFFYVLLYNNIWIFQKTLQTKKQLYSKDEISALFKKAGFKVVGIETNEKKFVFPNYTSIIGNYSS